SAIAISTFSSWNPSLQLSFQMPLLAEARARIEARRVAQLFVELFLALGQRAGHHDIEHGVEISRAAPRLRQSFAAEAQLLSTFRTGRNFHRDAAFERRHFDLRAERRFPRRDRHFDLEVVRARLEERMRLEHDLQVEVPGRSAVHAGAAFAAQAQALAVDRAFRNARTQAAAVDLELALGTARRLVEADAQRGLVVLPGDRHVAAEAAAAPGRAAEDPHLLEQIGQIDVAHVLARPEPKRSNQSGGGRKSWPGRWLPRLS